MCVHTYFHTTDPFPCAARLRAYPLRAGTQAEHQTDLDCLQTNRDLWSTNKLSSFTSENSIEQISMTLDRLHSLAILRAVLHDPVAGTMLTLLRELAAPAADATIIANAYSQL